MKSMNIFLYQYLESILTKFSRIINIVKPFEMAIDLFLYKLFPNTCLPLLDRGTGSMEYDWDVRANKNALIVATGCADEEKAKASAVKALETKILKGIEFDRTWTVLEIGCGIGNFLRPLSSLVREIHGVDISGEMLRLAKERFKNYSNIILHKTNGQLTMLPDHYFDFIFSSGVFMHFPSKNLVYEYFKDVARVLKPGRIFRFQVDGRIYLKWRLYKGGTIRGVVFYPEEIKENLEKYGFEIREVTGLNTMDMWTTAILRKS